MTEKTNYHKIDAKKGWAEGRSTANNPAIVGIDSSRVCSRQSGLSGRLHEREPGLISNRRSYYASVRARAIETRLAHKRARLAAVVAVILLVIALIVTLAQDQLPSIEQSVKVNDLLNPLWTAESNNASAQFGTSVSSAGDVNKDGYDDVIIGAPFYNNGEVDEGCAFVYLGSSTGLQTSPSWKVESNLMNTQFGFSVSSAGDVNGDGYDDVIVGAPFYSDSFSFEGRAYVYLGSSGGLSITPSWTAEGGQDYAEFGYSVSSAGDVNGDGYGDVIVGAPYYSNPEDSEGRAFVYLGSSTGLATTPVWTAEGNLTNARFGFSVSSAGDVNGNGLDDVIIGAPYYTNGQEYEGRAFVYLGSSGGLSASPPWTAESNLADAEFGNSVSSAGNVNKDAYDDVIIGAHFYANGETDEGRAYVYLGSSTGLASTPVWTAEGNQTLAEFGFSVSSVGDLNMDLFDDVIVGAPYYTNGSEIYEGSAFVYFGSSTGPSATPSWTVESNLAGVLLGWSVSSAGDVNNDGYDDVIIGAPMYTNGQSQEGRAYLYGEVVIPEFTTLLIPVVGAVAVIVALRRIRAD